MQAVSLERTGTIASGKNWQLKPSKTSAVESVGRHLVLVVVGNTDVADLTEEELTELDALPRKLMNQLRAELEGWQGRVETNHGLGTQPHFHAHLILVPPGAKVRRSVDSMLR